MNLDAAFQTFLEESRELLTDMEQILLDLESQPAEIELQNALFRCVHTVKGSAGMFGLDHVVTFTHVVENVLDRLRAGEVDLSRELANILLRCRDHISVLVEIPEHAEASGLEATGNALLEELEPYHSLSDETAETASENAFGTVVRRLWRIRLTVWIL
jgi:two-component system chemotaxis sensor kinase CheA